VVINDGSVAFDCSIHGEIAAIASVGDFSIFQDPDSHLNRVDSVATILHY
jgi:hypothetical protein